MKGGTSKLQTLEDLLSFKIKITVVVKLTWNRVELECVVLNQESAHRWLRERFNKSVLITLIHGNISTENSQISLCPSSNFVTWLMTTMKYSI